MPRSPSTPLLVRLRVVGVARSLLGREERSADAAVSRAFAIVVAALHKAGLLRKNRSGSGGQKDLTKKGQAAERSLRGRLRKSGQLQQVTDEYERLLDLAACDRGVRERCRATLPKRKEHKRRSGKRASR